MIYHNLHEINKYISNDVILNIVTMSKYYVHFRFSYLMRFNKHIDIRSTTILKNTIIPNINKYLEVDCNIRKDSIELNKLFTIGPRILKVRRTCASIDEEFVDVFDVLPQSVKKIYHLNTFSSSVDYSSKSLKSHKTETNPLFIKFLLINSFIHKNL